MGARIRRFEHLHIIFWLGKDLSWCLEWKRLGVFMIIPTLSLAIFITAYTWKNKKDFFHNVSVCVWIAANSIWMIGEFFNHEEFRGYAMYLFVAGVVCISSYYILRALRLVPPDESELPIA
jgi:hypothetical protein